MYKRQGDGGSIREIVKHTSVEKATLVEIDGRVIAAAKEYLPEISCALDDPKVNVVAVSYTHLQRIVG